MEAVVETRTTVAECSHAPSADEGYSAESAAAAAVTVTEIGVTTWTDEGGAECAGEPAILEEIEVEELAVDGICGVY